MADAIVTILPEPIGVISARLYGHFAEHLGRCCYDGLWVGPASGRLADAGAGTSRDGVTAAIETTDGFRTDVVEALRVVGVPILRWPGGCYADHYHWRDGIGPDRRRTLGMSCGLRVPDDNSLGTHEFLRLCELVGAEPYLAANVGTGSAQEFCDWIEYVNSAVDTTLTRERVANGRTAPWQVRYWGVGNESWDCGGRLDPATYAREFRRYATMSRHVDSGLELVAVGLEDEWPHGAAEEREWNVRLLETLGSSAALVDHLSIHRYWIHGGPAIGFGEADYYALLAEADDTATTIDRVAATLDSFPFARGIRIALDEWGVWHPEAREWGPDALLTGPGTYEQPNTLRDALAAAAAFEVFHRRCERLSMANLAQTVNVLQCLLVTDGRCLVRTPTYHAFELHRPHRDAEALAVRVETDLRLPSDMPAVTAVASGKPDGTAVTVLNRHFTKPASICLQTTLAVARARVLTADAADATNTATAPDRVAPVPLDVLQRDGALAFELPAHSMATLELTPWRNEGMQ